MIDIDTTLKQNLFEITIGHGMADVEEDRVQNDGFGIMDAFEINQRLCQIILPDLGKGILNSRQKRKT